MGLLVGPAGRTSWMDQLDGPVLFIWSLGQFAYSKIFLSVCILSQLPSPTKALFAKPSYWTKTFLSTAGTTVPIFLWPCSKKNKNKKDWAGPHSSSKYKFSFWSYYNPKLEYSIDQQLFLTWRTYPNLTCQRLTCPDLTCCDLTFFDLNCPELTCPDWTCTNLTCPQLPQPD